MFKFAKSLFFILLILSSTSTTYMAIQPKCLVCWEEGGDSFFRLSCGHEYCFNCIFKVVTYALGDHEYPRCPNPECRQYINNANSITINL